MDEIKLNDHVSWQGRYKGISFEIHKWKRSVSQEFDDGYHWNFYIFVKPRKLRSHKPDHIFKEGRVDYYKMYSDVEMHGGITFWTRHTTSSKGVADQIGCDYSHSWDYEEGNWHKLKENKVEWIMKDVKQTIDNLPEDLFFNK